MAAVDYKKVTECADPEIADKVNCAVGTIANWRKKNGLKPNKRTNPSRGVAKEDKLPPEQFICFLDGGTPAQLEWDMDDKEYVRDFCSKHKCIIAADLYALGEEVGRDPDDVLYLILWLIRIGQLKCEIIVGW